MPIVKPVPLPREYPKEEQFDRAREIEEALGSVPEMDEEALASLATKMNMVQALGIVKLSAAENASLKILSQKYIPDAPKRIDLKAEVKTEAIIMSWLHSNNDLRNKSLQDTRNMELEEDLRTADLAEFSELLLGEE